MIATRTRKTTVEDRCAIIALLETGEITQLRIAKLFGISQTRVSQIKREAILGGYNGV